jgi:hypothetical protein
MVKSLLTLILIFFAISSSIAEETRPENHIVIKPNAIQIPVGRFLIAHRGDEYCAVKLLSSERGKEEGEWKATYESYYQNDKSGSFQNKNVKYNKDELIELQPVGIGRLAARRSKDTIFCGKLWLNWSGRAWIYPYHDLEKDRGQITLAPTTWTEISEINLLDLRLVWYAYDENRKTIEIPVE